VRLSAQPALPYMSALCTGDIITVATANADIDIVVSYVMIPSSLAGRYRLVGGAH
jgi:hypothetical protein